MDFDRIKVNSIGRWVAIFRALGIEIKEDGKHGACPACGGKDRFRFDDKEGRGTYFCGGCGAGDGFSLIMKVLSCDIKAAMKAVSGVVGGCDKNVLPKENKISKDVFRKMFVGSEPATESNLVGKYLFKRGLSVVPQALRYIEKCWEPDTKKHQRAMLAIVTLPDGTASTMHRTFLDSSANKLKISSPKKLMPVLIKGSGGAIRLFEANREILGVAEGIETAIAAHEDLKIPVWSTISTSGMVAFEPPESANHVVIVSDNDKNYAGQKAAYSLAHKLSIVNKIAVSVYIPVRQGHDWLDQFLEEKSKTPPVLANL